VATFFQLKSFLSYWLNSVDEHSLHSPFFYDFYTKVVKQVSPENALAEKLRSDLLKSDLTLTLNDLGAGSVITSTTRKVSDIARISLSPIKYSQLYARTIAFFKCKNCVELGTSLGINTLYLAEHKNTQVTTFEGANPIAEMARDTFSFGETTNIRLVEGNIDDTLHPFLRNHAKIDFVLIDANHRYEAAIRYFEKLVMASHDKTILVFDDIHLNAGMEKAWKEIQAHKLVYATADVYRCGFVFLDPSLTSQHWILQF
jgi:predicted O-methyltransferase YrrM